MRWAAPLVRLGEGLSAGLSVDVARDGAVAIVTIDREDALNALNVETLTLLRDRLHELGGLTEVRAVVLTGAGGALAAKSTVALSLAKRLINLSPGALETEADQFGELFSSQDAKEGLAAFIEKRAPRFVGR